MLLQYPLKVTSQQVRLIRKTSDRLNLDCFFLMPNCGTMWHGVQYIQKKNRISLHFALLAFLIHSPLRRGLEFKMQFIDDVAFPHQMNTYFVRAAAECIEGI